MAMLRRPILGLVAVVVAAVTLLRFEEAFMSVTGRRAALAPMLLGLSAGAAATEEAWAQPKPKMYKGGAPPLPDCYTWCWQKCYQEVGQTPNYCSDLCEGATWNKPPPTDLPLYKVEQQAFESVKLKNGKNLWEAVGLKV
mmetsp:Transcript_74369/g.131514  ORF Transcript_74369/g.131514 Transcript_74369/m.131514 type:complete len:140 (-) Transcript_74369:87-506(-)